MAKQENITAGQNHEYVAFMVSLFDDELNNIEKIRAEAEAVCRASFGDDVVIPKSPAYLCVVGFILGVNAGFRTMDSIKTSAKLIKEK